MKTVAPVLAAGSVFALTSVAGLAVGFWIGQRTGQGRWVLGGFFGGLAIGGYAAFRLLVRSL